MTAEEMKQAMRLIEQETDASAKALLLTALVSEEFRARGFEPVIVGGSAIEFYTDGAYMSGDVKCDWAAVMRIASGPEYRCSDSLPTPAIAHTTIPIKPDRCYTWEQWQAAGQPRRAARDPQAREQFGQAAARCIRWRARTAVSQGVRSGI